MLRRDGFALILVVVVLASLMMIVLPFAVSVRLRERGAANFFADYRQNLVGETLRNYSVLYLYRTHESREREAYERAKKEGKKQTPWKDDLLDSPEEWQVPTPPVLGTDILVLQDGRTFLGEILEQARGKVLFRTSKGEKRSFPLEQVKALFPTRLRLTSKDLAQIVVEDEQGKLDLNTLSPLEIGFFLGSTWLSADVKTEDTTIPVVSAASFFSDGDPETIDGLVVVNGEILAYRHIGKVKLKNGRTSDAFLNCLRGVYFSGLTEKWGDHKKGSFVYDARAWKIVLHPVWKKPGEYHPYERVEQIREICQWSLFDFRREWLKRVGFTLNTFRQMGVGKKLLRSAGFDLKKWEKRIVLSPREEQIFLQLLQKGIPRKLLEGALGYRLPQFLRNFANLPEEEWQNRIQDSKWVTRLKERLERYVQRRKKRFENLPKALKRMAKFWEIARRSSPYSEVISSREVDWLRQYVTVYAEPVKKWTDWKKNLSFIPLPLQGFYSRVILPYLPDIKPYVPMEIRTRAGTFYALSVKVVHKPHYYTTWVVFTPPLGISLGPQKGEFRFRLRPSLNILSTELPLERMLRLYGFSPLESLSFLFASSVKKQDLSSMTLEKLLLTVGGSFFQSVFRSKKKWARALSFFSFRQPVRSFADFTYSTGNVYRLTFYLGKNTPAGLPQMRRVIQEVVRVAPPGKLKKVWDRQWDFTSRLGFGGPEFSHVRNWSYETYPFPLHLKSKGRVALPSFTPGIAGVRRPSCRVVDSPYYTAHFDEDPEDWISNGRKLENQFLEVETRAVAGVKTPHFPFVLVNLSQTTQPTMAPLFLEFWVKPLVTYRSGEHTLFEVGRAGSTARLAVTYRADQRELVLSLADDTLDPYWVESVVPLVLEKGKWYHVAIAVLSSHPGRLTLVVDGKHIGRPRPFAHLTSPLTQLGTISLSSTEGFPKKGLLRIGKDVFAYRKKGKSLFLLAARTPWKGSYPVGTEVYPYGYVLPIPSGGYKPGKAFLKHSLPTPTPVLSFQPSGDNASPPSSFPRLEKNATSLSLQGAKIYPIRVTVEGQSKEVTFSLSHFPQRGYLRLEGKVELPQGGSALGREIVFYHSLNRQGFHKLERGEEGTTPQKFLEIHKISLLSIEITDSQDYPKRGKVQLYRSFELLEWIDYRKAEKRPNFLLLLRRDYGPNQIFLRTFQSHFPREKVMPVYPYVRLRSAYPGRGDRVTLFQFGTGGSPIRFSAVLARVKGMFLSFTDHLPQFFGSFSSVFGLILKWPTGLLPLEVPDVMRFGGRKTPMYLEDSKVQKDYFSGIYDEIRINALPRAAAAWRSPLGPSAPLGPCLKKAISSNQEVVYLESYGEAKQLEIMEKKLQRMDRKNPQRAQLARLVERLKKQYEKRKDNLVSYTRWYLRPNPRYFPYTGNMVDRRDLAPVIEFLQMTRIARLGEEIVYVQKIDFRNNRFFLKRGVLGKKQEHVRGTAFHPLPYPLMRQILGFRRGEMFLEPLPSWYKVSSPGYVWIQKGGAVWGYHSLLPMKIQGQKRLLVRSEKDAYGRAVFRQCFGSSRYSPRVGDLVVFLPWRYRDVFDDFREGSYLALLELRFRPGRAYFRRLTWRATGCPGSEILVRLRVGDQARWRDSPLGRKNGLFEFRDPRRGTIDMEGEEVQIRVYMRYKSGAFSQGLWKNSPVLHSVELEYEQNSEVLHHEER